MCRPDKKTGKHCVYPFDLILPTPGLRSTA